MRCVQIEQLLDFAQDRAEAAVADLIRSHLASGCVRCQENLDWVQKVVRLAATDDSVQPPERVLSRAVRLFELYGPQRKPSLLKRMAAALVFDSLSQPQLAGVRHSAQTARQCLYRADQWDVDLSFEAGSEPGMIDITGQILRGDGTNEEIGGIPIHLVQSGETLASTVSDRLGEFIFDQVANGTYSLNIDLSDQQLWIEQMDVKLSE